ncbi:HNH/ENDO VII family nuclease [Bartonella krasnovii]|nr:HNH/ENDO VII family nuclease [Bartonella krasnovii]
MDEEKKRELTELFEFKGKKVYQEDKLFEPETISSWKEKGQIVYGTNIERMASGRAPIGVDCRPIMLYPITQEQNGSIREVLYSFYQEKNSVAYIHPNTNFIRKTYCWIFQKFFSKKQEEKND